MALRGQLSPCVGRGKTGLGKANVHTSEWCMTTGESDDGSVVIFQEKAIPLAIEGKDLLIRAKTGSGKTAA